MRCEPARLDRAVRRHQRPPQFVFRWALSPKAPERAGSLRAARLGTGETRVCAWIVPTKIVIGQKTKCRKSCQVSWCIPKTRAYPGEQTVDHRTLQRI